jgi:small subunit ribosomal protein S1
MNDEQPTQSQVADGQPGDNTTLGKGNGVAGAAETGAGDAMQQTAPITAGDAGGGAAEGTGAQTGVEAQAEAQEEAQPTMEMETPEPALEAAEEPAVVAQMDIPAAEPVEAQMETETPAEPLAQAEATTYRPGAQAYPTPAPAAQQPVAEAPAQPQAEAPAEASEEDMVVRSTRDSRLEEVAPNASMEDLLRASEQQYRTLKHGDVVEGTVMRLGRDEILVDIGAKTEGIIPQHELQSLTPEEREALAIGDTLLVSVVQPENNEGHAVLSLDRARQERSWRDLQKRYDAGEVIQARVTGHNKGGLLVNLEGVRGFVPSSQISSLPPGEANKQAEMARMQNQTLPLKIIEINRNRNRLILSERQAMQEQREAMRTRLLGELSSGQIRRGRVSSICDFGAFVDIGGADGLIHLSELSWKRVSHPSDVLKVGDEIDVYVLSVDPNERKIALSLKRTQPEPWSTITENYHLGQLVRGTITQLTTFGAFARLEDGIEGLIHVSELAEGRVAHPKNVVNVGDSLELKVIRIDPAKRRIGLSLKRVNEDMPGGAVPSAGSPEAEGNQYTDADPMSQAEMVEAHSTEVSELTQQGRTAMPVRQLPPRDRERERERQLGRDRQDRQDRGGRDQRRASGASSTSGEMEEEPMGALGQALAARLREMGTVTTDEEVEEPTIGAAPTAAPEVEAATSVMAEEAAPEMEAEAEAETVEEAAPEAEAEVEVVEEAAPEVEVEAEAEAPEFESVEAAVEEPEAEASVEEAAPEAEAEEPVAEAEVEPEAQATEEEAEVPAEDETEADVETSMPAAEEVAEATEEDTEAEAEEAAEGKKSKSKR